MNKALKIKNNEINWICLQEKCPRSCCGPFSDRNMLYDKLYRPCFDIGHEAIILTSKDVKRIKNKISKKDIKIFKDNNVYINLNKDNSCPFFKNGLCSIYYIRPQLCRAYPFYLDPSSGLSIDILCPGIGKGYTEINKIKEYIQAMNNIYKFQIKNIQKFFKK